MTRGIISGHAPRPRPPSRAVIALLALLSTGESCRYDVRVPVPAHIGSIYIAPFQNRTQQEGLEGWVTEAVIERFVTNGRLAVLPDRDRADAELIGEIIEYRRIPISWDQTNTVVQYRVQFRARIRFVDRLQGATLQDEILEGVTTYSVISQPPETERDAILRAADEMARDALSLVLEGRQFQDDEARRARRRGDPGAVLRR